MKMIKWLIAAVLITAALYIGSKTITQAGSHLSDTEVVEIKSVAWLKAMVAQEWDKTYPYTSPGYRSGVNQTQHIVRMASRRVQWLGGEIIASQCEEESCTVDIRVVFKLHAPVRGVKSFESFEVVRENWVKLNNEWWLVPGK